MSVSCGHVQSLFSSKETELINMLRDGEMSVNSCIVEGSNLSQHLSMMRERRILVTRKEGNAVYYRIADSGHSTFQASRDTGTIRNFITPSPWKGVPGDLPLFGGTSGYLRR